MQTGWTQVISAPMNSLTPTSRFVRRFARVLRLFHNLAKLGLHCCQALSQAKMARDAQTGDLPLGSGGHSASRGKTGSSLKTRLPSLTYVPRARLSQAAGKYAAGLAEQNATHPIIEQESIKIGREWAATVDEDELIARVAQEASMAEPDAVGDTAEAAIHLADSRAVDLAL